MERLGYDRYGAQGSDWGTSVTTCLGQQDPGHLAGIHLIPPLAAPDPATFGDLSDTERAALTDLEHAGQQEAGYAAVQSTKPQTIGYGLADSPAALCAWIVEKFRTWTDCDGHPENAISRDELLDNVMLYWLPGTGASATRLYWESFRQVQEWFSRATTDTIDVPAGSSIFLKGIPRPSRRWTAKRFTPSGTGTNSAKAATSPPWSNPTCTSMNYVPSSATSADGEFDCRFASASPQFRPWVLPSAACS
nr:hypothetical protein [Actinoallomurus bryophytorum]